MKKKHFAGVLMLTAAVALGTVSPVALPNTAIEVKAEVTYSFKTTDNDNYAAMAVKVLANGKIEVSGVTTENLGSDHVFGYGEDESKAIAYALSKTTNITSEHDKFTEVIPSDTKVVVIVKKGNYNTTPTEVIGGKVDLTTYAQTVQSSDYENTENKGQAKAKTALQYRKKGEANWENVATDAKFPTTAVPEGTSETYEVRKAAVEGASGTGKLASPAVEVTIVNKKQIGLDDLKALKYEVTADSKIKVSGAKTKIADITTKVGTVAYKTLQTSALTSLDDAALAGATDITTASDAVEIDPLNNGESVVFFVKDAADKATKNLVISVKQGTKPEVQQKTDEYKLVKKNSYTLDKNKKYEIKSGANYTDAVVKGEGADAYIEVPGSGNYVVREKGGENKISFATENKQEVMLPSADSEAVNIASIVGKIDKTDFDKLTFATKTVDGKLALQIKNVSGSSAVLSASTTDKLEYGYEGESMAEIDKTYAHSTVTVAAVKAGKFVVRVKGNSTLAKTINFIDVADKDGKPFAKKYQSPRAIKEAMGTVGNYKIREKGAATAAVQATGDVYSKTATYLISYNAPTNEGAVTVTDTATYKLKGEVEVLLQTEADAAKENSSSGGGAVIPSGGGSAGGSTDTKKDDAKKTDDKKNDTKKDGAMSDGNGAAVDKQSSVTVKNTKKNTVKVSEEKVAEALETGLKVTARSGEVKFTVKALKKVVGDAVEAVKVTLKATSEMAKNVKGSKLVSKQVFTLNIKAGNMTVKESQLNGTKINVTLKVNLKKAPKIVWVMDLSTGKRVKAAYKKGKLMFKTANLGKFVLVNKAK